MATQCVAVVGAGDARAVGSGALRQSEHGQDQGQHLDAVDQDGGDKHSATKPPHRADGIVVRSQYRLIHGIRVASIVAR
jgi:hypothetical protein